MLRLVTEHKATDAGKSLRYGRVHELSLDYQSDSWPGQGDAAHTPCSAENGQSVVRRPEVCTD